MFVAIEQIVGVLGVYRRESVEGLNSGQDSVFRGSSWSGQDLYRQVNRQISGQKS